MKRCILYVSLCESRRKKRKKIRDKRGAKEFIGTPELFSLYQISNLCKNFNYPFSTPKQSFIIYILFIGIFGDGYCCGDGECGKTTIEL